MINSYILIVESFFTAKIDEDMRLKYGFLTSTGRLPLSDVRHGANKMCPPEVLHTMDAGLTIYVFETLQ